MKEAEKAAAEYAFKIKSAFHSPSKLPRLNDEIFDAFLAGASHHESAVMKLLERAAGLVGNPGTNISSSTDIAAENWQKDYEEFMNTKPLLP